MKIETIKKLPNILSMARILSVAATQGGKVIAAGWLGKIKTVLQDVALTAYILHFFAAPAFMYGAFCVLFALSAVMTVWSCADYIMKNREVLMEGVR